MKNILVILFLVVTLNFAQDINIIPQLKKVESGNFEEVRKDLVQLKKDYSNHPDVIFLEAVITEDGEKSRKFYELIYNDFPASRFADAALFRSFSYYYALGLYKRAEELKQKLYREYPKSPYLKNTKREFPDVDEMILVDSTPYKIKDSSKSKFSVQAGAFSNFKNADELKSRFISDGFVARIKPKRVNNIQLHVVTVGNFKKRTDAERFLLDLQQYYSLKGRVIELD